MKDIQVEDGDTSSRGACVPSRISDDDTGRSQPADLLSVKDEDFQHILQQEIEAKKGSTEEEKGVKLRKPWKDKKTIAQAKGTREEIEIFEGKGVVSAPSFLKVTSPMDGYLKIICKNECSFVVPHKVAEAFECVDTILYSDGVFKERLENVVRFPDIEAEIMEHVLRFVFIEHLNKLKAAKYWGANSPRLVFQFEVDPGQVMDLIYVAHFLGVEDLLNVTATMVARRLADVSDVSSMPMDLAWCVAEQFTAQELYDAEERQDFLSLNLGTDVLWEKHCKKFLKEDIIRPVIGSASPPSYDTWGFCEGPPPTSWKSLFIALDLQQLADRQDGGGNESFFQQVEHKGKCAYSHTIRPMFYEWVLGSPGSLPLSSYLALFPHLMSLHLVKLPLGNPLGDGTIPCLVIGEILQSHPLLQILDVSESGLTAEAASLLSKSLRSHPSLQVLRLAYNNIGPDGFTAIAEALQYARTMKFIDVRGNQILSPIAEEAVRALRASTLEEILLEGAAPRRSPEPSWARGFGCYPGGSSSAGNIRAWKGEASKCDTFPKSTVSEVEDIQGQSFQAQQAQATSFMRMLPILSGIPPTLRKLVLTQSELVDSDMVILVEALCGHTTIQKLDLTDNSITAVGATTLFSWLQANESLLELYLSSNRITGSCAEALVQALQSRAKLQKLSLRGNYTFGEESLPQVINAGIARGEALLSTCGQQFILDLRATDISFATRARIQRQTAEWSSQLHLLI